MPSLFKLCSKPSFWLGNYNLEFLLLAAVASISAGNDEFVGNLIAETIEKIGSDGVISLESSSTSDTFVIIEEGMKVIKLLVLNMVWKILADKSLENWHYIKVYVRSLWFYVISLVIVWMVKPFIICKYLGWLSFCSLYFPG